MRAMNRSSAIRTPVESDGSGNRLATVDAGAAVTPAVSSAAPIPVSVAPNSPLADLDALGRTTALGKAFDPAPVRESPAPEKPANAPAKAPVKHPRDWQRDVAKALRPHYSRILKTLVGVVVIAVAGWMPVRALLQTTSTEAIINARLITLRAPIEGQIDRLASVAVGTELQSGAPLLGIINSRAERGRLDSLAQLVSQLEGEIAALTSRQVSLQKLHQEYSASGEAFRAGRMAQLQSRIAETQSEISAASAKHEEAQQNLDRAQALSDAGTGTLVALERAQRDATVAKRTLEALGHRRNTLDVELVSLEQGIFVGDSYNDRPQSLQRADDITLRLNEVSSDIGQRQARLTSVRTELAEERGRFARRSMAALVAPTNGSVWEVMTSPGESVVLGQDLVRLLDCSGLVVTATVGEAAYNNLHVGQTAKFRFRGESTDHVGRVISLTGVATAPANLAIQPAALAKEPYRVTVAVPELVKSGRCSVGRTGRVTFGG
jgi:multidrug resistance efflux pump